ncbi:MAG: thiamine pyrophosphate-binding protein [Syntrophorhabdaceae bacterium]|nr:thiamine pyrophosphate-binding protein [Syntrophorhabdaceae bacterium]
MLVKTGIIEFFKEKRVNDIFHLPGIHTLPLIEALSFENINVYMGRHESGAGFMADGYARSTGKTGTIIVTPGPGLGNVVTVCMEAYNDDIPLVIIHIDTGVEKTGRGTLHELSEPEGMFRGITKSTFTVTDPEKTLSVLNQAYDKAKGGRKGPVLVSIPHPFLEREISNTTDILEHRRDQAIIEEKKDGESTLEKILFRKKRPLIIGGRGLMSREGRVLIEKICLRSSIPFLTTTDGKGVVREDAIYAFGNIMQRGVVREMVELSDLILAIGTRLREADAVRRGVRLKELVHIDFDERWMDKNYRASLKITGDIDSLMKGLSGVFEDKNFEWDLIYLKKRYERELNRLGREHIGYRMVKTIRDVIPDETMLVCELNYPSYWAEYYFPVYEQNAFIMPRGISPVFCALPVAIGAKIGMRSRPCLCIVGDGGILPTVSELSTIIKYDIPVVIIVHNNGGYGILEDAMTRRYGMKGTMLLNNPDFLRLASSFGIKAKRTKTLEGLKKILLKDISWDTPYLVEFTSPVLPPPWV